MPPVNAFGVALVRVGIQALTFKDLYTAQPGLKVGAVKPDLEPLPRQARGHAVHHALGREDAEFTHSSLELLKFSGSANGQRP